MKVELLSAILNLNTTDQARKAIQMHGFEMSLWKQGALNV